MEERVMDVVPGLEGIPAAESAIRYIDGEAGILEYRGIPVETLAEKSTFLETAYLLLFGNLPNKKEFEKLVLVTRATPDHARAVRRRFKDAVYHEMARCLTLERKSLPKRPGTVAVLCAGTSDL